MQPAGWTSGGRTRRLRPFPEGTGGARRPDRSRLSFQSALRVWNKGGFPVVLRYSEESRGTWNEILICTPLGPLDPVRTGCRCRFAQSDRRWLFPHPPLLAPDSDGVRIRAPAGTVPLTGETRHRYVSGMPSQPGCFDRSPIHGVPRHLTHSFAHRVRLPRRLLGRSRTASVATHMPGGKAGRQTGGSRWASGVCGLGS
jgi:hypothetical protein